MNEETTKEKILELIGTDPRSVEWAKMPYSFWAKMPHSVWANMPEIKKAINEPGLKVENLYSKILASIKTDGCALDQSDWECGSTCCIGGWTKHHAGEAGQKLKELIGYRGTAMIIHRKSRPGAPFPNYNGSTPNDATMAYIKARAAEETK